MPTSHIHIDVETYVVKEKKRKQKCVVIDDNDNEDDEEGEEETEPLSLWNDHWDTLIVSFSFLFFRCCHRFYVVRNLVLLLVSE